MKKKFHYYLDFLTSSLSVSLNFFFSTLLIIILSLIGFLDFAAEVGITVSLTLFLSQIFSANHRQLIFSKNYKSKINSIIQFRFFVSILIVFISIAVISRLQFQNVLFLILLSILICTQWIAEIFLTIKEKQKKNELLNYLLFTNILFIIIITLFIFLNKLSLINIVMFFLIMNYLFIFNKNFRKFKIDFKNLKLVLYTLKSSLKNFEIISSFSLNFSNLIWRFSILLLAGKSIAGLLFGSYALGSFFGTLYSNIIAPKIHSKKIFFPKLLLMILIPIVLIVFYYALKNFENFEYINDLNSSRLACIFFSLIGSFFMLVSLIIRFNYFYNVSTILIFKLDILYSVMISLLISVTFVFLGLKYLVMAYLFASLSSLLIYSLTFLKHEKNY